MLEKIKSEIFELQQQIKADMPENPAAHGFKAFSQSDEDGIIQECLHIISNQVKLSGTFIEIGCGNGLENNTHYLLIKGFSGCWFDANQKHISYIQNQLGKAFSPRLMLKTEIVTLNNITTLLNGSCNFLDSHDIDVFSIDIDGNDGHILAKALETIQPKLIITEYNAKFPPPLSVTMDYSENSQWAGDDYFGASLQYFVDVLQHYTLVACNLSGVNAFFIRNDCLGSRITYNINQLYQPARFWQAGHSEGHPASLKWLQQSLQQKAAYPRFINAQIPGMTDFRFEVHTKPDQCISQSLIRFKHWESYETEIFMQLCQSGNHVLDLGANIGWYTVIAAKLIGKSGSVHAFEPDPDNFAILKRNVAISNVENIVTTEAIAVSDTKAEIQFYASKTNMGDHKIFADGEQQGVTSVPAVTLADYFDNYSCSKLPNLVKSDTQGSEGKLFKGAKPLFIENWRPVILFEFYPYGLINSSSDPLELLQYFYDFGYELYEINSKNKQLIRLELKSMQTRLRRDLSVSSLNYIDILAIMPDDEKKGLIKSYIKN